MFLSVCNGMSLVLVLSFGVSRVSVLCLVPRNSTGSTWVGPNLRLAQDREIKHGWCLFMPSVYVFTLYAP